MLLVFLAHAVGNDLVGLARKIERMPVGQVSAMGQIHAQDRIAGLEHAA